MLTINYKIMKINNINIVLIFSFLFLSTIMFSQNLRWSFQAVPTGGNNSTVMVYIQNVSAIPENIASFDCYFYYQNPLSTAVSIDPSPATTNLWPNNGLTVSGLATIVSNGQVSIPHNRFANISLFDTRIGGPGTIIPGNSTPIHILNINFTNQNPPSLGWLAESDEQLGIVYSPSGAAAEFDIIVIGQQFSPLPVSLSSFSATKHTERSSRLNWTTSSEINSDFFGIERSKDGNTWETIGRVAAAGNSSKELAYEFIDDNLPLIRTKEQVFYYRLRMTDLDGQYKYSDVRGVNFGKLSTGVVTIYPNPTVEHINVDLSGMDLDAGKVDLFVYDMSGRQLIKKSIIGNGIELIDVSQLPANTYNVVVKQGETAYQQRVIKID